MTFFVNVLYFRAPIWSNDEAIFGRMQTNQVWFYEVPNFGKFLESFFNTFNFFSCLTEERYVNRLNIEGLQMFSLGKSNPPYTIAAFIKGKKVLKIFFVYIIVSSILLTFNLRVYQIVFDYFRIQI